MNLVEFWQAPIRRLMNPRDLPEKDAHRSPAFIARAHKMLKGRETVKHPDSGAVLARLQVARIAVDTNRRKAARIKRWANVAENDLEQAQARGDDLLRELYRLEALD